MVANEVSAAAAVFESSGHRHPDRRVFSRSRIAARKPHDRVVLVTLAEEFAKDVGTSFVEHFFRMCVNVPRLGGHQSHDQPQLVRAVDHVVHVLKERLVGPRRVAVHQWRRIQERGVAVRVFLAQSAQHVRLDYRKTFLGAVFQVLIDLGTIGPLEEKPARVAQVEERLAVLVNKVAPVGTDPELQILDGTRDFLCGGCSDPV